MSVRVVPCVLALVLSVVACGKSAPPPPAAADARTLDLPVTAAPATTATTTTASASDASSAAPEDAVAATDATPAAADASAPPTPSEAAPFLPVKSLPMTLQYVRDGAFGFAVQVTDAGVPGLANAFKVKRIPAEPADWCMTGTYFGDFPAPDNVWKQDGCYLAQASGLWWFETCPTSAAAAADPEKAGGVLAVENVVPKKPAGEPDDEEVKLTVGRFELDGKPIDVVCGKLDEAGMSKHIEVESCVSPLYGLVSVKASGTEMEESFCDSQSVLVAVEPGLKEPRTCMVEPGLVGKYRFTTRLFASADKKGIGTLGRYALDLTLGDGCKLAAHLEKLGIDKKDFAPDAVQKGEAKVVLGASGGALLLTLETHLADAKGKGFDATYSLSVTGDTVQGSWLYDRADAASGFRGLLLGAKGEGDALAFDTKRFSLDALCGAAFGADEDYDKRDECIHCEAADCARKPW